MASTQIHVLERWAAWFRGAVGLALLCLIAWGEYSSWRTEVASVEREAGNLAASFLQHAEHSIEETYTPLASLAAEFDYEGPGERGRAELKVLMDRILSQRNEIDELVVLDATGEALVSSVEANAPGPNARTREFFAAHAALTDPSPRIGVPVKSPLSGRWVIPVTMRLNHADGSFAGIVLAAIPSRSVSDYLQSLDIGPNGSVLLTRRDGTVLARSPFDEKILATSLANSPLFTTNLSQSDHGAFHYTSPVDGVKRIGGFRRSGDVNLIVLAALSQEEAIAAWVKSALPRWIILGVVVAGSVFLAFILRRRMLQQRATDQRLAQREAEFELLTRHSHDLVERIDTTGIRQYVSPASNRVLGRPPEELVGTNAFETVDPVHRGSIGAAVQRLRDGSPSETIEFRSFLDGRVGDWLETTLSVLPSTEGGTGGVVAVTRDISSRKQAQEQLAQLASLDGLTGIANRRAFDERYYEEFNRARRTGLPLSVVLMDADRFKAFNDTYGHLSGDACLKAVAAAVSAAARRPGDFVARYGGEEIVAILPNTGLEGAHEVAERMRLNVEELGLPHDRNQPFGKVTISLGVASLPEQARVAPTPQALLELADWALYQAKETGRNRVALSHVAPADELPLSASG